MSEDSKHSKKLFTKGRQTETSLRQPSVPDSISPVELPMLIQVLPLTSSMWRPTMCPGMRDVGCSMPGHRNSGQAAAVVLAAMMRIHRPAT